MAAKVIVSARIDQELSYKLEGAAIGAPGVKTKLIEEGLRLVFSQMEATRNNVYGPINNNCIRDADDNKRLKDQRKNVYALMSDGRWRTVPEIARALNFPDASIPAIGARLRDFRQPKFGGHTVERQSRAKGLFEFRLVVNGSTANQYCCTR